MDYQTYNQIGSSGGNVKSTIVTSLLLCLFFSVATVLAAWEDDANARIESIRKRDVQITVIDANGSPLNNVSVQLKQTRHLFGFGTCLAYGRITNSSDQDDKSLKDHHSYIPKFFHDRCPKSSM